jgi:hypothetical protein
LDIQKLRQSPFGSFRPAQVIVVSPAEELYVSVAVRADGSAVGYMAIASAAQLQFLRSVYGAELF